MDYALGVTQGERSNVAIAGLLGAWMGTTPTSSLQADRSGERGPHKKVAPAPVGAALFHRTAGPHAGLAKVEGRRCF